MPNDMNDKIVGQTAGSEEGHTPLNAMRMRRQSMEQLSLIQLTPDKKKEKRNEEDGEKKEELNEMGDPKGKKKFKKPTLRAEFQDLHTKSFFAMISRRQSDKIEEQRTVLNSKEGHAQSKRAKHFRSASSGEKIMSPSKRMRDLKTGLQSEGIDSQRVELRPVFKKSLKATKGASVPGRPLQRTTLTKSEEDFFEMIARIQGSRLDDQRTEMPCAKPEEGQKTLSDDNFFNQLMQAQARRMEDQRATIPAKSKSSDKGDSTSKKPSKRIWDLKTGLQSERIDSQRVELRPVVKKSLKATKGASVPGRRLQRTTLTKSEEDFFEMIARIQGSRLDDQRTELPRPKPEEGPKALPDDDFFNQLMRAQADRMDDQRATIPAKSKTRDKGDSTSKK